MAQVEIQSVPTNPASKSALPRRFVVRFIVSSVSSTAGLISFVLTGPVMCRIVAIDPALEALSRSRFRLALVTSQNVVAHLGSPQPPLNNLNFKTKSRRKEMSSCNPVSERCPPTRS